VINESPSSSFPYLSVRVRIGNLQYPDCEFDVEAFVDTGFDGGLAVPQGLIPGHVLPRGQQTWIMADGSGMMAPYYRGSVTVGALQPLGTDVIVLPKGALLGRAVTNRYRLTFVYGRQVIHGY
jgi:hypothetical protein